MVSYWLLFSSPTWPFAFDVGVAAVAVAFDDVDVDFVSFDLVAGADGGAIGHVMRKKNLLDKCVSIACTCNILFCLQGLIVRWWWRSTQSSSLRCGWW